MPSLRRINIVRLARPPATAWRTDPVGHVLNHGAGGPIVVRHLAARVLAEAADVDSLMTSGGRVVGVAGQRVLDEVVAEFEASCAQRLDMFLHATRVIGGAAEFCGSHEDPSRWTVAYVRTDGAVLPLAVGERDRVVLEYDRLDKAGTPIWDDQRFPPPKVIVDGAAYHFWRTHGRLLLGRVWLNHCAVLLAAIGDQIAVIHVAGRTRTVLHVGSPHSFRELDVDHLLRLQGRARPRSRHADPPGPVRPPPTIEAEHRRIIHGLLVDVGTGPTIAQVLTACFEDVADRADALTAAEVERAMEKLEGAADRATLKASAARRVRGKKWVKCVAPLLCTLAIEGHGDIVGRVGVILKMLLKHFPKLEITSEALSDALGLLHAVGTCLIGARDNGDRIWTIKLAGLPDPRSSLHRRLCRETKGRHLIGAIGATEKVTAMPPMSTTTDAPLAAEVDAVPAPVAAASAHDTDIKEILEVLCRLPARAGSDLIAAMLTTPTTPAHVEADAASLDAPVAAEMAPASAPERDLVGEDKVPLDDLVAAVPAPESAPERDLAGEGAAPLAAPPPTAATSQPEGNELKAAVDRLYQLPVEARRTLLLGTRVFNKWRETAGEETLDRVAATPADASIPHAPPGRAGTRHLHLSPDHTLATGASGAGISVGIESQMRDAVLGRVHPVGDGPHGARAPPSAAT